jgi:hypothetical protein
MEKESSMSIQKLIDQTYSYFVEAQGTDLASLYEDDLTDFQSAQWMINADDIGGAKAKIDCMDTEPREQIVMAITAEYGAGYVETVLGYEVA